MPHRKQMRAADPKEPAGPPQGDQRSGGSTQTTTMARAPSYRGARVRQILAFSA